MLLLSALVVLSCIDQDDARHSFGHSGGETVLSLLESCFCIWHFTFFFVLGVISHITLQVDNN